MAKLLFGRALQKLARIRDQAAGKFGFRHLCLRRGAIEACDGRVLARLHVPCSRKGAEPDKIGLEFDPRAVSADDEIYGLQVRKKWLRIQRTHGKQGLTMVRIPVVPDLRWPSFKEVEQVLSPAAEPIALLSFDAELLRRAVELVCAVVEGDESVTLRVFGNEEPIRFSCEDLRVAVAPKSEYKFDEKTPQHRSILFRGGKIHDTFLRSQLIPGMKVKSLCGWSGIVETIRDETTARLFDLAKGARCQRCARKKRSLEAKRK